MKRHKLCDLVDSLDEALAGKSINWVAASDAWRSLRLETIGTALEDSVAAAGDSIATYQPEDARNILRALAGQMDPGTG